MKSNTLAVLAGALAFTGVMTPSSRAQVAAVDIDIAGSTLGQSLFTQTVGWDFILNAPIIVTDLGIFDSGLDGFTDSHRLGIWDASGNLLLESTVPSGVGASLVGLFRYVAVQHTPLAAGQYVIGAHYNASSLDYLPDAPTSLTTPPEVSFTGPRYEHGSGLLFPSIDQGSGKNHFGPNFRFQVAQVPDVAQTFSLLLIGLSSLVGLRLWPHRSKG